MKPVQEQEQNQQQTRTGREPFQHLGLRLDRLPRLTTSADTRPGKFPKLTTTLRAEALARLLEGGDVSGVASVFASGSTKLATVMRALTRRYHWPIERQEFATNMADGRGAWVSRYALPEAAIANAFALGAEAWIEEVRAARSKRLAAPTRRSTSSLLGSNTSEQAQSSGGKV